MVDREVSLVVMLSWVAWVLSAGLVAASFVPALPSALGAAGVFLAVVAATMTLSRSIYKLHQREVAAFNLGRESVRSVR